MSRLDALLRVAEAASTYTPVTKLHLSTEVPSAGLQIRATSMPWAIQHSAKKGAVGSYVDVGITPWKLYYFKPMSPLDFSNPEVNAADTIQQARAAAEKSSAVAADAFIKDMSKAYAELESRIAAVCKKHGFEIRKYGT